MRLTIQGKPMEHAQFDIRMQGGGCGLAWNPMPSGTRPACPDKRFQEATRRTAVRGPHRMNDIHHQKSGSGDVMGEFFAFMSSSTQLTEVSANKQESAFGEQKLQGRR